MKKRTILISPAKAIINEITPDIDVIICTSDTEFSVSGCENVLLLRFDDITDERRSTAFNMQLAQKIFGFVTRETARDTLFVCCDSGVSRSSAITAALTLCMGDDDLYIWDCADYSPNTLVFGIMCAACGVRIEKKSIELRKMISENALKRMMN